MKKTKSLKLMYLSLGAVVISVAAVGFSNWIVINTTSANTGAIKAEIGEIKTGDLTAYIEKQPDAVRFDAIVGDGTGSITTGTDTNYEKCEKLDFSLTFSISKGTIASFDNIAVNLKFNTGDNEGATNFINYLGKSPNEYIDCTLLNSNVNITLSDTAVSEATTVTGCTYDDSAQTPYLTYTTTVDAEEGKLSCTLKYTFRWGDSFGNQNPCNEVLPDTAVANLTKFGEAFNDYNALEATAKNVVLTITPSIVNG